MPTIAATLPARRPSPLLREILPVLERADVRLDGARPWDLNVRDDRLFARVIAQGTLGFGEAYMDGWWECEQIDELISRVIRAGIHQQLPLSARMLLFGAIAIVRNLQSVARATMVTRRHYDLGNDFFASFLGQDMQYSCGYFRDTDDLDQAQRAKLDLIRRKLQLRKEDRLLDIGCGWGGLARHMAMHVGCGVTAINISKQQIAHARQWTAGLPVEIRKTDYRALSGSYDKIVSVGMFEHVGSKNYRRYMETAHRCLQNNGLFLLHTIGANRSARRGDPWLNKYIFPNGQLPSASQITRATEGLFVLEDWHSFGEYYDKTLLAWHRNFEAAWPRFASRYGERFRRMWRYYLLSCAGAFRAREIQLWQIVLSKNPLKGYVPVR